MATKRTDGRIEIQIIVGKTDDGKYIRKSFYGKTVKEAKEKCRKWQDDKARNEAELKNISMSDWAIKWAETYKKNTVSYVTYKTTYLYVINNYIIPYFGQTKLRDIRRIDVQGLFNSCSDKSSAVRDKIRKVLSAIFDEAIENDLCTKNPCKGIKLGKYTRVVKKKTYNMLQRELVLYYAAQHENGIGIYLMLTTGIRRGELLALSWDDIDLKNDILYVRHAVKGDGSFGEPKSAAGIRAIPFDNRLHEYLVQRKDTGFVIKNQTGGYMYPTNYDKRVYNKFMDDMTDYYRHKIKRLTAHELRHTYGTLLRARGVDIYTIQKVMGHADIRVTAEIYVENDLDVLRKNLLFDEPKKKITVI